MQISGIMDKFLKSLLQLRFGDSPPLISSSCFASEFWTPWIQTATGLASFIACHNRLHAPFVAYLTTNVSLVNPVGGLQAACITYLFGISQRDPLVPSSECNPASHSSNGYWTHACMQRWRSEVVRERMYGFSCE